MDIKIASLTSFRLLDKMYNIKASKDNVTIEGCGHSSDFYFQAGEYLTEDDFYSIIRSCCDSQDDEGNFEFRKLESIQKVVFKLLATIAQSEDVPLLVEQSYKDDVLKILGKAGIKITKTMTEKSEPNFRRIYFKKLSIMSITEDNPSWTSITIGKKTISVRDAVENAQPAPKIGISKTKFEFNFK